MLSQVQNYSGSSKSEAFGANISFKIPIQKRNVNFAVWSGTGGKIAPRASTIERIFFSLKRPKNLMFWSIFFSFRYIIIKS